MRNHLPTGILLSLLLSATTACGTRAEPEDASGEASDQDATTYAMSQVDFTLTLDSDVAVEGSARLGEYTTTAGTDCIGGVVLSQDASGGVIPPGELGFIDSTTGTSSTTSWELEWYEPGDTAEGLLGVWRDGTYVVSTWSDELIELTLEDGTRCDLDGSCSASSGTLTISGARDEYSVSGYDASAYSVDVASGQNICGTTD